MFADPHDKRVIRTLLGNFEQRLALLELDEAAMLLESDDDTAAGVQEDARAIFQHEHALLAQHLSSRPLHARKRAPR
ncbi:MAG: hypothetical protein WDO56_06865 [Gammaproteobacteria bacterium]